MDILNNYINIEIMMLCLLFGNAIKHSFPKVDNDFIPLLVMVLGIVISACSNEWTIQYILIGAVSGLASTGAHQIHKGLKSGNDKVEIPRH